MPDLVKELITSAEANKKGPAELENHITNVKTPFIQDGLTFITNGIKFDDLKAILQQREKFRYKRESHESDLMKTLGTFSPAFGMVGTLIGLVFMLFNMGGDPGAMGPAMAVALLTTFYGVGIANLIFIPFSEKLIMGPLLDKKVSGLMDNAFNTQDLGKRKDIIQQCTERVPYFCRKRAMPPLSFWI